jgi:hypothetical protein
MERGEQRRVHWFEDEDGYYYKIKTELGTYELRPEDTCIFKFSDEHRDLDHIYRVTEEREDSVFGFRLYRYQLENKGFNFDQVCLEMQEREFDECYEDYPNQEEIDAYIRAGNTYPIVKKLPSVEVEMLNFDAEFNYYLGENGEWT